MTLPAAGPPHSVRHVVVALGLLWLAGNALRLSILAVPPVITAVQADLAMSGTEVGILSGMPVVLFALVAVPGALLIARVGAVPALLTGLLVAALGTLLRGVALNTPVLLAATALMGAGIAVMQPALPAVVRQWLPTHIGLGTAVFTNGLIVGEIIPVALMAPLVVPAVQGNWRYALASWALPMLLIAVLFALARPKTAPPIAGAIRPRWWPDWRHPLVWRPGLMLGSANAAYFGSNTFLPPFLQHAGHTDLIPAALTALNLGQLPASLLLLVFAGSLERRMAPFVALGVGAVACLVAIVLLPGPWTIVFAALLGFCAAGTLALSLTLPALLRPPQDVGSTSAAMFMIGYTQAMAASVLGGAAWDLFGGPAFAFLPIGLAVLPLIVLPATIDFGRRESLPTVA